MARIVDLCAWPLHVRGVLRRRGAIVTLQDRAHFVRYAARAMRSVVVDFVRRRAAERRGCDRERVELTTGVIDTAAVAGEDEILTVRRD